MIRDEGLVAESRRKGALLRERLDALAAISPRVGDVRGLGLLQGLELVRDRETLNPVAGAASRLVAACRERGLMIYSCPTPMGVTTIEAVMLAPPLTIADAELDEIAGILGEALRRRPEVSAAAPAAPPSARRGRRSATSPTPHRCGPAPA